MKLKLLNGNQFKFKTLWDKQVAEQNSAVFSSWQLQTLQERYEDRADTLPLRKSQLNEHLSHSQTNTHGTL